MISIKVSLLQASFFVFDFAEKAILDMYINDNLTNKNDFVVKVFFFRVANIYIDVV